MGNDYERLFPLLADYWDKSLAELPDALRVRVKQREAIEDKRHVIGSKPRMDAHGDLIPNEDGSYPAWEEEYATRYEGDFLVHWESLTSEQRRQQVVQIDDHNDPNSITNTVTELVMYLGTDDGFPSELGTMISNAQSKGQSSVVVTLKELSEELAVIVNADIHRSVSDSSLWRELSRFSKKLPAMNEAIKGTSDYFAIKEALGIVAMRIESILNIDRARIGDDVTQRVTPAATGSNSPKVGKGKAGRPKTIDKKIEAVREMMARFECAASMKYTPQALCGSAADLLDACQRFEKSNKIKPIEFSTSQDTFNGWLKRAGYSFPTGRTPDNEKKYWTQLVVKVTV
jgi:hypothetical protein